MSSTELGLAHGFHNRRLREICRRRLLEEMVSHVLSRCEVETAGFAAQLEAQRRPYLVLITDSLTLRIVNAACQVSDLLTQSIWGVQCIGSQRQALPVLEAVYFVEPTDENIEQLLQDMMDSSPKYRCFHVFFSYRLGEEQLRCVAGARDSVRCIHSFAELNLGFLPHDDRAFHLAMPGLMRSLLLTKAVLGATGEAAARAEAEAEAAGTAGTGLEPRALAESAWRLATLLASCLPARPSILHASGAGGPCEALAQQLQARLSELEARGVQWQRPSGAGGCVVLLVDRSIDWLPLLVHDMHYESLLHDILGRNWVCTGEGRFTYWDESAEPGGRERSVVLGDAKDGLWERFRHLPVWEVNALVAAEIKSWRQRDEEMRRPVSPSATVSQSVSNTLNTLHSLPEHQERFDKLLTHSDFCQQCLKAIEAEKLVDVGALEQDLATGAGVDGSRLVAKVVERQVTAFLRDPELDTEVKLRLLLLFLSTAEGAACPQVRRQELAACLALGDRQLPLRVPWLGCARPARRSRTGGSPRSRQLRRWQPRLRSLMEDLARGALDPREFPEMPPEAARGHSRSPWRPGDASPRARASATAPSVTATPRSIVLFVLGGVTLPELREAHEAASALGLEVYVGGSCILTPSELPTSLRGLFP